MRQKDLRQIKMENSCQFRVVGIGENPRTKIKEAHDGGILLGEFQQLWYVIKGVFT